MMRPVVSPAEAAARANSIMAEREARAASMAAHPAGKARTQCEACPQQRVGVTVDDVNFCEDHRPRW